MSRNGSCNRLMLLSIGLAAALLVPAASQADYIFLSDGHVLRGKVQKEGELLMEGGQVLWTPKLGGFYLVDDHVRRIIFSSRTFVEGRPNPVERREVTFHPRQALGVIPGVSRQISNAVFTEEPGPWNAEGQRSVVIDTGAEKLATTQCITAITPHFVRVGAKKRFWMCSMLTSEFNPQDLLTIIRKHQEASAKGKPNRNRLEERLDVFRFCVQTGWYDEAEEELQAIEKEFGAGKNQFAEQLKELRQLQAGRRMEDIELAAKVGQHARAQRLLEKFPEEHAAEALAAKVRAMRDQYQERLAKLAFVQRLLSSVIEGVKDPEVRALFNEAIIEITQGLNLDTYLRLDTFVSLARQEEKNREKNRPADLTPEQLLALAVSGWALGDNGAEANVKPTLQLWQARRFILAYLRAAGAKERGDLMKKYTQSEAVRLDVVAQLIGLLPPPLAEKDVSAKPLDLVAKPQASSERVPYRVQVPPEYHHNRPYPVLVVLHKEGEEPKEMLARWSTLAARHGYLLVAPQWAEPYKETKYHFSEREHQAVIGVLRDVGRRFNVDSERVFLAGFSQSALMAYDIGLSHPDLWAGVVVMCGRPAAASTYKTNGQLLPFYVVEGTNEGQGPERNRKFFQDWMANGYPSLYVEYHGRGYEFYHGELPYIFDWMSRKKRARGVPELGSGFGGLVGQEFRSYRATDNHFYWISIGEPVTKEAKLTGRIADVNQIMVHASGVRQLTVWLNSAMVDFQQKVDLRLNPGMQNARFFNQRVQPSMEVLLEDFRTRGDKHNLFMAKVEFRW